MYLDAVNANGGVDVLVKEDGERAVKSFSPSGFVENPIYDVLLNNFMDAGNPELSLMFFDIETDSSQGKGMATDARNAPVPIISFAVSTGGSIISHALLPDGAGNPNRSDIIIENDENDLILKLMEYIAGADVICGYNSQFFDIPYLINRTHRIFGKKIADEAWREISPFNRIPFKYMKDAGKYGKQECYRIFGTPHLDYKILYSERFTQELPDGTLDTMAEQHVGAGGLPHILHRRL